MQIDLCLNFFADAHYYYLGYVSPRSGCRNKPNAHSSAHAWVKGHGSLVMQTNSLTTAVVQHTKWCNQL